jgi:DNA-binding NarL/FixJ family response regulator
MNFLVSKNPALIDQFWSALQENGNAQLLPNFAELTWRGATSGKGIALIDTKVADFKGPPGLAHLKRTNPDIKILLLTEQLSPEDELSALAAGAAGSCGPNLLPDKIRQILATVEDGGVWISSAALPQLLHRLKRWESNAQAEQNAKNHNGSDHHASMAGLTPREREIVNLVAKGDSNKIIARELNITDRTVKAHLSIIFQKLKVNDRLQLALLANRAMAE